LHRHGPEGVVQLPSLPPAIELASTSKGKGHEVLALHDLGQSGDVVLDALKPLSREGFRITAPDLRGHGESPSPESPWSIDDFASDVARVIASDVGQTLVVGVGLGGATALALALGHPNLVTGLVVAGVGPRSEDADGQEKWIRAARGVRERLGDSGEGIALAAEAMGTRPDWRGALPQIETPAVVLAGADDHVVPVDAQRELSAWIRGSRFAQLPDTGHDLWADAADDLAGAIRRVAGVGSPAVAA
jgi:3-oxoadipate enol-lactonase